MKGAIRLKRTLVLVAAAALALQQPAPGQNPPTEPALASVAELESFAGAFLVDAVMSGRLPPGRAAYFLKKLAGSTQGPAGAGAATQSGWQRLKALVDLDELVGAIENEAGRRLSPRAEDDLESQAIESVVSAALGCGRLDGDDYVQFLRDRARLVSACRPATGSRKGFAEQTARCGELDDSERGVTAKMRPRPLPLADIDSRQALIERRMKAGARIGALTSEETADLKDDCESLSMQESNLSSSDGGLNPLEALFLAIELDRLDRHVSELMFNQESRLPGPDELRAILKAEIDSGLEALRLPACQADELREEAARIVEIARKLEERGQENKNLILTVDIDRLVGALYGGTAGSAAVWSAVAQRLADIDAILGEGVAAGRLQPEGAGQIWRECRQLADNAGIGKTAQSQGYTDSVTTALALDLMRQRCAGITVARPDPASALAARKDILAARLADGLAQGRLPMAAARQLARRLERLAGSEAGWLQTRGYFGFEQATALSSMLAQLESELSSSLAGAPACASFAERRKALQAATAEAEARKAFAADEIKSMRALLERTADCEKLCASESCAIRLACALRLASMLDWLAQMIGSR